jgi:choline kinase
VDHKDAYDADDMKVALDPAGQLLAVGKELEPELVRGESIGLLCFREAGAKIFREALEETIRAPGALRAWYLSVVDAIAQESPVETASVRGLWWREIDSPADLEEVRRTLPRRRAEGPARLVAAR